MNRPRVGINGFGRIGRAIFRINKKHNYFDVVAINDINKDINNIAYLLKYDSTYGRLDDVEAVEPRSLLVGDAEIPVYCEANVAKVPWEKHGVDIVVDSSGVASNAENMKSVDASVGQLIVTNAPAGQDHIKTIIFGVNEDEFLPKEHRYLSSSICDTIALCPLMNILSQNNRVESGFLTTLHPWLSYQNLLDGPSVSWSQPGDIFSHYALGRSSVQNLIPKSTSAVRAANHVFPGLSDTLQSFSYRVPTSIVSSAVLVVLLEEAIDNTELLGKFERFEAGQRFKVIRNSTEPLTSLDYLGDEHSVVLDHRWTQVENGRHVKLVYWYDNEWGYSSRTVDLIRLIAERRAEA